MPGPRAAILFEPDGYELSGERLMGRQAAGHGFLRAAIEALKGEPLHAYSPYRASAEVFARLAGSYDPNAKVKWLRPDRLDVLREVGTLYVPGPELSAPAWLRLRAGPDAFSIVGVTHTTASHTAMDAITNLLSAPLMPWDALICTSAAVGDTVKVLLTAQIDYLKWRLGARRLTLPQLPVIPLGIHCNDFVFSGKERAAARRKLGVEADDIVALFSGRLSHHAKAHPHAMYAALEWAAAQTGRRIVLLQCGWFANAAIENAFKNGAAQFCPSVSAVFTDGRDPKVRREAWAAADLFISLADNIQETFGLTPIEAMAAGLPVLVSDWNGYKETVRDGVDGFRIRTFMPPPNFGEPFARAHEAGFESYDVYIALACRVVSVDPDTLRERLLILITNDALRRQFGAAGQAHARQFDWKNIFARYQELWAHLAQLRHGASEDASLGRYLAAAPRAAPARLDPFRVFAHYPSAQVTRETRVQFRPGAGEYEALAKNALYSYARHALPTPETVEALTRALAQGGRTIEELSAAISLPEYAVLLAVSVLAKMGLVRLDV